MKNVIIFGAGMGGKRAFNKLSRKHEIVAFIDNDKAILSKELCGVPIQHPSGLKTLKFSRVYIASMHYNEIKIQLAKEYQIAPKKIRIVKKTVLTGEDEKEIVPWLLVSMIGLFFMNILVVVKLVP